jgi:hypothetical protein
MLQLLTRRDLWIVIVFSAIIWFGLNQGPLARFAKPFATLVLVLSLLTIILSEAEGGNESDEEAQADVNDEGESLYSVLLAQSESQKKIQADIASLREEIKSVKDGGLTGRSTPSPEAPQKLGELSGALSEAMKQISSRDSQLEILTKNLNLANIQRNLIRLTQSLEVARTLQARVSSGKSEPKESFDFLVDDLDSALSDQGVESQEIAVGTKVADLAAGSFATISVVDTSEEALRGTVKEVRSRCYFISEEGKKPRYIAPAKVILYRV